MEVRSAGVTFALGAAILLAGCAGVPAPREEFDAQVADGRRLVAQRCAGCHSTDAGAASVYRAAPPLTALPAGYTPDRLQRAAADQAVHAFAMPRVILTLPEAEAIVAYLRALEAAGPQERRRLRIPRCIGAACPGAAG